MRRRIVRSSSLALGLALMMFMPCPNASAQLGGGPNIGGGGGGGGGGGIGGANFAGGIIIDADGVISAGFSKEKTDRLTLKRLEALAKESLSEDLNRPSDCRNWRRA